MTERQRLLLERIISTPPDVKIRVVQDEARSVLNGYVRRVRAAERHKNLGSPSQLTIPAVRPYLEPRAPEVQVTLAL